MSNNVNRATLCKEINGILEIILPKTVADIVEYDNSEHDALHPSLTVQDKLDELHDGLSALGTSAAQNFTNYYTKADINDILYAPVVINSFTSNITVAEIGSGGSATLSYSVTRMTQLTNLTVAGETLTNPDTSDKVMQKTFTGTKSVAYSSSSASATSQSFSMSVTDTATTGHAATTASKSVTINYYYPVFWGMLDSATINATQVVALTRALKSNNKGTGTYSFPAGSNAGYMWFCCQSGSSVSFSVGGFVGGFESPVAISGIDINGITASYKCYRSTNRQTSNQSVVVS